MEAYEVKALRSLALQVDNKQGDILAYIQSVRPEIILELLATIDRQALYIRELESWRAGIREAKAYGDGHWWSWRQ